jgi:hypothetical protein
MPKHLLLLAMLTPGTASAGVFLHYAFDGDFVDDSGNGYDGTLVVDGGASSFVDSTAAFGQAWSHQVQDDEDRVVFPTPFDPGAGAAWTVAFWHDMSGGASCPLFDSTSDNNTLRFRADIDTATYLRIAGQDEVRWSTAGVVGQGTFNHVVVVADPAGIEGVDADGDGEADPVALYIDGALQIPDDGTSLAGYATSVWSDGYGNGGLTDDTYYNGHGYSDELWIFLGDALDADQIASLRVDNDPCLGDVDGDGTWDCVDVEACDGVDNDGDGSIDEADADLLDGVTLYADVDGDGLGDPDSAITGCEGSVGFSTSGTDLCPEEDASSCDGDGDGCWDDADLNGTCDLDQVFQLSSSDAVAGQRLMLSAAWATPGATVVFVGSAHGTSDDAACATSVSGAALCVDLIRPTVLGTAVADGEGAAALSVRLPAVIPAGTTLWLQAVTRAGDGAVAEVVSVVTSN